MSKTLYILVYIKRLLLHSASTIISSHSLSMYYKSFWFFLPIVYTTLFYYTSKVMHFVILENIRSAYNVGNIIRTADALGWWVVISWYTARPSSQPKVAKSSLGAEKSVTIIEMEDLRETQPALDRAKKNDLTLVAAEITESSTNLVSFTQEMSTLTNVSYGVVFGNEVQWVEQTTLDTVDYIVHIPMLWVKSSLNVWQSCAILMRELSKNQS